MQKIVWQAAQFVNSSAAAIHYLSGRRTCLPHRQAESRGASPPEVYTLPPVADELNEELPPLPPLLKAVAEACPLLLVLAEAPVPPAHRKRKKTVVGGLQYVSLRVQVQPTDCHVGLTQACGDKHQ